MDTDNSVILTTGTTDDVNWQEQLEGAILLATEAQEGLRSWGELSAHLHDWWYATLADRVHVYWPAEGPPEVTYG